LAKPDGFPNQQPATDTLWCRFRLSYDNVGSGDMNPDVASKYHGEVSFGEVEDYALYNEPIESECQCDIEKTYVGTTTIISSGGSVSPSIGSTETISVAGDCGRCEVSSYNWTITKPDGSSETRSGISFNYTFGLTGRYTFEVIVNCPDGTSCNWITYVDVSTGPFGHNPCSQFEISGVEITYPADGITRSFGWPIGSAIIIRYSEELSMADVPLRGRFIVDRHPDCEIIETRWDTRNFMGGCVNSGNGTNFEILSYCMGGLGPEGRDFRVKIKKVCFDMTECEMTFNLKVVPMDWGDGSPEK